MNNPERTLALLQHLDSYGDAGGPVPPDEVEYLEVAGLVTRTTAAPGVLRTLTLAGDDVLHGRTRLPSTRRIRTILWANTGRREWATATTRPGGQPVRYTLAFRRGAWVLASYGHEVSRWDYPQTSGMQEALNQASGHVLDARDGTDRHTRPAAGVAR